MIAKRLFALLLVSMLFLSGCRRTDYAENQVYAVMLGIDAEESNIRLTIRYPKLAGSQGGSSGSGESGYDTRSASGADFQEALDRLRINALRQINLSALTTIIVSDELASSDRLPSVLDGLAANYRMYSSAYIGICSGSASEFIEAQEPEIGSRLSEGLKALIENAEEIGSIPGSRLSDVYYRMNSIYSDPLILLCRLESSESKSSDSTEDTGKSSGKRSVYAGSCAIRSGKKILDFTPEETLMINILSGDIRQFSYVNDTFAAAISVDKGPDIRISAKDTLKIDINLKLSGNRMNKNSDMETIVDSLENDLYSVINKCRTAGTEPFGFADRAVSQFATLSSWNDYRWTDKFKNSDISISISLTEVF